MKAVTYESICNRIDELELTSFNRDLFDEENFEEISCESLVAARKLVELLNSTGTQFPRVYMSEEGILQFEWNIKDAGIYTSVITDITDISSTWTTITEHYSEVFDCSTQTGQTNFIDQLNKTFGNR